MRFIIRSARELKLRREIYRVGILSLVTAFLWIGFDLYRAYSQDGVPKVLQDQLRPLNPSIDVEQVDKLESRISPSERDLNNFVPILPAGEEAELVTIEGTGGGQLVNQGPQTQTGGEATSGGRLR